MSFKLTILGSNSALPTSERFSTAQVLQIPGRSFLLDCGEGTQIQLRRNKISFESIKAVFFTHLHGDHYFGIFGLLSSFNLLGRKSALKIYGPTGIKNIIETNLAFLDHPPQFEIQYVLIDTKEPTVVLDDKSITVKAFPLKHRIPCYGYLFFEKQKERNIIKSSIDKYSIPIKTIKDIKKGDDFVCNDGTVIPNAEITTDPPTPSSYAFCTDTAYNPSMVPILKKIQVLYHEATFNESLSVRAKQTFHSTAKQAASIAKQAEVSTLLIGHFSARITDTGLLLKEATEIFPNTIIANDGTSLEF